MPKKQQESCLDWTPHKAEIKEHYLVQNLSLKELLKYMEETYAFRATFVFPFIFPLVLL